MKKATQSLIPEIAIYPLFWLLAFGLIFLSAPHHIQMMELNPDEGGNLASGVLLLNGFRLYRDIWSDQPPIYTLALGVLFGMSDSCLTVARLLTQCCSATLLVAFLFLLRSYGARMSAVAATLMLLVSPGYLYYSNAAMVSIPALCAGIVALALFRGCTISTDQKYSSIVAVLAGISFGCGLLSKLYGVLLLPTYFALATMPNESRNRRSSESLFWFFLGLGMVTLGTVLFLTPELLPAFKDQIIGPHLSGEAIEPFVGSKLTLVAMIAQDPWLVAAAILAVGLLLSRAHRSHAQWSAMCPPLIGAGAVLCAFALHYPIWPHYQPMLSVYLCWIIGIGLQDCGLLRHAPRGTPSSVGMVSALGWVQRRVPFIFVFFVAIAAGTSIPRILREHFHASEFGAHRLDRSLLAALHDLPPTVTEVFTDSPLYPIVAHRGVVPWLAVCSIKRRAMVGDISQKRLQDMIVELHPAALLSTRFLFISDQFLGMLSGRYAVVWKKRGARLLVRRDLLT